MGTWSHITIGRDRTNRLHVARCLRCGALIVAGKSKGAVESATTNHHCETKSRPLGKKASHKREK